MHEDELVALLREQLLGTERPVVRSGVERLWKTGRGAAGLALSVVGGRLRGKGEGLGAADVEAIRGCACGETIRSLMEKHLVKIAGRAEEPGRPILSFLLVQFYQ